MAAILVLLMILLCGCGKSAANAAPAGTTEKITDEQAISAIKAYCFAANPELEKIAEAGEYPVYWEIASGDDREVVVLFRSYTGAQLRYYIDRVTGDTYYTEFVPGITTEEQPTEESFNLRDHLSGE